MKNLILAGIILIAAWGCNTDKNNEHAHDNGDDQHHEMQDQDHSGHDHEGHAHEGSDPHGMMGSDMNMDDDHADQMRARLDIDPEFHNQLNKLFDASMEMKEAFVESDPDKTQEAASSVIDQMGNVDSDLLGPNAREIWMSNLKNLSHMASRIEQSNSIDEQREQFAMYNRSLYRTFQFLGHEGEPIYYQYCPMAFDNKGAYWLSSTEEIRNPYFGDRMMTCGSTKEVIN